MAKRKNGILIGVLVVNLLIVSLPCFSFAYNGWNYKNGKKYSYELSDGSYAKGALKIKSKVYFFRNNGVLAKGRKLRMVKYNGEFYDIARDGTCRRGWNLYNGKLYYFGGKNNKRVKNAKVGSITIKASGEALMNLDASIKKKSLKIIKSVTKLDKPKHIQLKAAYNYVSNSKHFKYASIYPDLKDKSWVKIYADKMLSERRGNCYGFAATFAALAHTIGYDAYVVTGRIRGPRDGSRDGFTRHACTKINGRIYDTEAKAMGWMWHAYKRKPYPYRFKNRKFFRFGSQDGTVIPGPEPVVSEIKIDFNNLATPVNSKLVKEDDKLFYYDEDDERSLAKNLLVKAGDFIYLTDGNGAFIQGAYYYDKKLLNFNEKTDWGYGMSLEEYNRCQEMTELNKPVKELLEKLGDLKESRDLGDSCYDLNSPGIDKEYTFENMKIMTFAPYSGEEIIIDIKNVKNENIIKKLVAVSQIYSMQ